LSKAEPRHASATIRHLQALIEAHDWEHNLAFTPVAFALMWSTHVAGAVERWRARHGHAVRAWIGAVGEIEAFSSVSAYRYEHPSDPFPEIVATVGAPGPRGIFDGSALGHPLLPPARMVVNDVRFAHECGLLLVSGSNMSGKSTLLRTVGVNAVLALAGAPVRGASLRISPLDIGATLRIQDSLQEGRSRFYAEITRVRRIVDMARNGRAVLFLLDELFHGTNSHDRLAGASGVLRGLVDLGAIGLVTTHDLALTEVVDRLAPRALNVHFEDRFEHGEMVFDYVMKPGPVTRSNALALMRAVGLEVEDR
jgi:DNA mismatch repair ATPase MutS